MENSEMLMKALDNENNLSISKLNSRKIAAQKNDILQKLQLKSDKLKEFHKKLKDYRYVDDLQDILYGSYIRWIPLKDPENVKLTNGGIVINLKILNGGVYIGCKNNINHYMQIKLDENLVFQKIQNQEKVLLSVIDYLDKN